MGTTLLKFVIPNSVNSVGYCAFLGTPLYENQPDGMVYVGLVAYQYKGIMPEGTHITLKAGTKGIADNAFDSQEGLTSIDLPNSLLTIGNEAFRCCINLTDFTIPNSVTTVGSELFALHNWTRDHLESITIGRSVKTIGRGAFQTDNCVCEDEPILKSVTCLAKVPPTTPETEETKSSWFNCTWYWYDPDPWHTIYGDADYVYDNATLYVPVGSEDAYRNADDWCRFKHIVGKYIITDEVYACDVNGDGEVNIADINAILSAIMGYENLPIYDVNGDGEITVADINAIIKIILDM